MGDFELSKWYADCVSESGDALILYSAELRWRGLAIHYANLLTHRADRPGSSRFSLRQQPPPAVRDGCIEWKSRAWHAEGIWNEAGIGLRETLFDSPAGRLEWECLVPRAAALLRVRGEQPLRGWGYVEHLRLSLPPWRLPMRQLRWGRFINATDGLIWIDWRGPYNRQVVYHNGAPARAESIGDREIVLADGAGMFSLDCGAVLREGLLGSTALAVLPNLDRLFPSRVLRIHERKWLSRAVLRRPGQPDSTGLAIHEVVEWP
ncbi:MAG TPA: hypothetical protein VLY04_19170 [Bryobacteraceae bacterium]|nr:hypothetical protein [Bryobacteraceae bacterium]